MADVKISDLAAVSFLTSSDVFEIEQAAESKKVAAVLIHEWVTRKGTDTASAGTLTLGDGELFHITGTTTITDIDFTVPWSGRRACLIFDGALTIIHHATTLMLPGGADLRVAAGDRIWLVVDSLDNVIVIDHISALSLTEEFWIRQAAAYTLANSGAEQKLFNAVANGTLTLPVGVYFFECLVYINSMSATSGNAAFDILGAGTSTLVDVLYYSLAAEVAANTIGAPQYAIMQIAQTPAAIATAATATVLSMRFSGSFEVSVAGTIIPSITLATATAAALVAAGSYFTCRKVGGVGGVSNGPWS